jgi:hypothetical protein
VMLELYRQRVDGVVCMKHIDLGEGGGSWLPPRSEVFPLGFFNDVGCVGGGGGGGDIIQDSHIPHRGVAFC